MESEPPAVLAYSGNDEAERLREAKATMRDATFDVRTVAIVVLTLLAVFYTLYLAAEIILPLLFALVLNLLLQPPKRLLHDKLHIPNPIVALLLIGALFCVVAGIVTLISVPASGWIAKAPESLPKLQERLGFLSGPIGFVRHGMDQLQRFMESAPSPGQQQIAVQQPSGMSGMGGMGLSILNGTRAALGQVLTFGVVLFFLLASGDGLLRSLVEILPSFGDKRRVVEIANEIERNISGYLATITMMNVFVGLANGISMYLLGMPDPLLWGVVAFLLNYIPILGPVTGITIFFFVGLFSSPSLLMAVLPPAIYFGVHVIEGETVTPMLLARRFTLNPVLVIVALFFWDWLWGVPGAFLAVPLLAITKIVCDRIPSLTPLGHLLGASRKTGSGDAVTP
jgi:predicted PurR-regulated permease PerM